MKIRCIAGSCSLEISEVTVDDDGSYLCKAINSAGVASTKTSVQVTGEYCILHPIPSESSLVNRCSNSTINQAWC